MADDSIFDKMIEMGMGMTIANQIPRMMNSVMPDQTPSATPPHMPAATLQVYAIIDNRQVGPLNEQECIALIQKGMIVDSTLVWKAGLANWVTACQIPEIGKLLLLHKK